MVIICVVLACFQECLNVQDLLDFGLNGGRIVKQRRDFALVTHFMTSPCQLRELMRKFHLILKGEALKCRFDFCHSMENTMSHHEVTQTVEISEEERDANSRADMIAALSLVAIVVTMVVFFVSR